MRKLASIAVALAMTVAAVACGDRFRRDSDSISWFLTIANGRYTVEICDLSGRVSRFEGNARQVNQFVILDAFGELIGAGEKGETKFVKARFGDEIYFVEEGRREEFEEALREDAPIRRLLLLDFFRQVIN